MNKLNKSMLLLSLVGALSVYAAKEGQVEVQQGATMPDVVQKSTYFFHTGGAKPGYVMVKWRKLTDKELDRVKERLASIDRSRIIDDSLIDKMEKEKKRLVAKVLKDHRGETVGMLLDNLKEKFATLKSTLQTMPQVDVVRPRLMKRPVMTQPMMEPMEPAEF